MTSFEIKLQKATMHILYIANSLDHLHLPIARHLVKIVGAENFRFAVTRPPYEERKHLGWNNDYREPWILRVGENEVDRKVFDHWWDESDVLICNERLFGRMQDRVRRNMLTFYTSERWWKPPIGMARLLHPGFALMTAAFLRLASSASFHYLPVGLFAADDIKRIAAFKSRMWQWGYFTEPPIPMQSSDVHTKGYAILWAGRMVSWKRVDTLIRAFSLLQRGRSDAMLTLVGYGPEEERLKHLANKILTPNCYRFMPPLPMQQILELMKQHHVYVLPSNASEGWGAVVNEAMSAGCAVIASFATGSARTMIRHGENGLLFAPNDWQSLADHLDLLGSNEEMRCKIAREGQRTISECWSPHTAAERFYTICDALMTNHPVPKYLSGPMASLEI